MASDDALNHLLSRTEAGEYRPGDLEPGDTSRISIEAFVAGAQGSARELASEGDLRLHGAGVVGTSAELADVSRITGSWQKLISAVGGALEDVKSLRGRLPASVITRTTLVLSASPSPGSVILHVRPKTDPFAEVAPTGDVPMIDQPRPLADRASEAVIEVLAEAVSAGTESLDRLTAVMQDLGPRVGSSLVSFADALDKSDITLDVSWREPTRPTRRAQVTPSTARWLQDFVAGRDLDAEVVELTGVLRTISDADRWLVDVEDSQLRMNATGLESSAIARFHVGQRVALSVRISMREQPDGLMRTSRLILSVRPAED